MSVYDILVNENKLDELNEFMFHYNKITEMIKNNANSNELMQCFISEMFETYLTYISNDPDDMIDFDLPF